MQFFLFSTAISFSFNVSNGPPTTVNCTRNGKALSNELSREILNGTGSVTRVTVTLRQREGGNYQCTVSNDRVTNGTIGAVTAVNSTSSASCK